MLNNYLTIIIAFFLGQFAYTTATVYLLQKNKPISYGQAFKAYITKEIGWFIVALAGVSCILFISSDYIDLSIKRSDLLNKEVLTLKEKIIVYFRTISLCVGAFVQHLLFLWLKKGKTAVHELNEKISSKKETDEISDNKN